MKNVLALLLLLISQVTEAQITLRFKNTPILEALQTIEQSQSDYSIAILSDGLSDFRTSAEIDNLTTIKAVKLLCKDLPLKIKTKGNTIYVQFKNDHSPENREKEIEISGNVEDGFLEMPLPHAKVSICRTDSSVIVDSAAMFTAYNPDLRPLLTKYTVKVTTDANELLVHARLKGYNDVWKQVIIGKRQKEVEVPPIRMRKRMGMELGEVVVKATRVKMFYRGDTIVYDATAFKLPQGSMLDDLIKDDPLDIYKSIKNHSAQGKYLSAKQKDFIDRQYEKMLENRFNVTISVFNAYEYREYLKELGFAFNGSNKSWQKTVKGYEATQIVAQLENHSIPTKNIKID